eukprot:CAMPEP_0114358498 /NCGR_PEP_ID=MMETSP0101-20121206/22347_1 /TAXON_ID=38822 ORGANISM="Pteridomonas danica, Strain PT" /NCGR_SAMPLE_ID=MMETSP0101 /ASSEMBLY_ACC=CAM_ASM_000211 /LENGTH=281 /DNA_ID=CAMNT_0001501641 /DNA_START=394 /DNA_END=1237 /DNA_ORIENTATION=-
MKLETLKKNYLENKTKQQNSKNKDRSEDESAFEELEESDSHVVSEITYASRLSQLVCLGFNQLLEEVALIDSNHSLQNAEEQYENSDPKLREQKQILKQDVGGALDVAIPTVEFLKNFSLEVTTGVEERLELLEHALLRYQSSVFIGDKTSLVSAEEDKEEEEEENEKASQSQESELESMRKALKSAQDQLAVSKETIENLTEDNASLFEKWTSFEAIETRADELEGKLIDYEVDTLQASLEDAKVKEQTSRDKIEELNNTNQELQEEVERLFASSAGIDP